MIRASGRPVRRNLPHRSIGFLRNLGTRLKATAPVAAKLPTVFQIGPHRIDDDYAWMQPRGKERKASAEVLAHVKLENEWADRFATKRYPLAKALLREIIARGSMLPDKSTEERLDGFLYYTKNVENKEWPVYCRRRGAVEEVLLDQNEEAKGLTFLSIGTLKVSPNSRFLAYTRTLKPEAPSECILKDLRSGRMVGKIPVVSSMEWAADNNVLFYTVPDALGRPSAVHRYRIGGLQASDVSVFEERDQRFFLDVKLSKDRDYIIIVSASKQMTESWVVDARLPMSRPQIVAERRVGLEYFVNHANGRFYIVSNFNSSHYRIATTDKVERSLYEWRTFYSPDTDITIEDVDFFKDYIAVWESDQGEKYARVIPLSGESKEHRFAEAPVEGASIEPGINSEYDTTTLRYAYSSLTVPEVTMDFDMSTGLSRAVREIQGKVIYNPNNFVTKRLWTTPNETDEESVSVPITVAHHKDLKLDGNAPMLLHGYGSYGLLRYMTFVAEKYGEGASVAFKHEKVSLLERGWVLAAAHVRGGGELGRDWYDQGRQMAKKNTFNDFIRVTEELITMGYTRPENSTAVAASAGGLLLGAVANMRPELYRAMVMKVPFLDVTTAMLDDTLPLTLHEYDEWGDPNDPRVLEYISSYDPYRNIRAQKYPEMLLTGALLDRRVPFWHPLKYVAKMRAMRADTRQTLLRLYMDTGHSGEGGRLKQYEETVLEYAFLMSCIASAKGRGIEGAGGASLVV